MSKAIITKDDMALLKEASEMFNETGCVPGIDGEQVPAERMVPDVKKYISEMIDDPEAIYDPEIWDTPGFTLVLSWLAQKWQRRCYKLVPRGSKKTAEIAGRTRRCGGRVAARGPCAQSGRPPVARCRRRRPISHARLICLRISGCAPRSSLFRDPGICRVLARSTPTKPTSLGGRQ